MLGVRNDGASFGCKEGLLRVQRVHSKVVLRCSNGNLSAVRKRSGQSDTSRTAVVEQTLHARTPTRQQSG